MPSRAGCILVALTFALLALIGAAQNGRIRQITTDDDSRAADNLATNDGRQLSRRRRHRRAALAHPRLPENSTSSQPSSGMRLDARCHAREHTGYAGDGAVVWGMSFKLRDAGECCAACKAHAAVCGVEGAKGKSWWPDTPSMKCGSDLRKKCTIWTFCPEERCFAFDIHKHGFGECWLKFQSDIPPPDPTSTWRLKDPHFGSQTYPEIMRHAPRKTWPWAVAEDIWPGPMPRFTPWISGALADIGVQVVSAPPNDRWKERWCKKHGPCPGERFDI